MLAALLLVVLLIARPWSGDHDTPPATPTETPSAQPGCLPDPRAPRPPRPRPLRRPRCEVDSADYVGRPVDDVAQGASRTRSSSTKVEQTPNDGTQDAGTVADLSPTGTVDEGTTITIQAWAQDAVPDGTDGERRLRHGQDRPRSDHPGKAAYGKTDPGKPRARARARRETERRRNRHRIGGRYELGELLGRGGMAEVRKGKDLRLGRTVAVKRLRTDLASDATFQARFRREAQSAASLNHPAIVSAYDTGEEMATDGSGVAQPYIVMEYVEGRTLRDIVREGRKILPERALEITAGVLTALDYSHRAGIIHRDIKPGNVMLTPSGDVKVMDFGIARAISDASNTMTQTAAVVGTAQYLSPEQARGETVDSRSDVYSTGCLLYELLTGRPPFVGDSPVAVAYQHVREQAQPPSRLDAELAPEIDAIVMKSLAKSVERPLPERRRDACRHRPLPRRSPDAGAGRARGRRDRVHPGRLADLDDPHRGGRGGEGAPRPVHLAGGPPARPDRCRPRLRARLFSSPPQQQSVPTIEGLTRPQAERTITDSGLVVGQVTSAASETIATGRVISQDPGAGDQVDPGGKVDFVVSAGKPQIDLPDVVGQQKDDAADQLRSLGVRVVLSQRDEDAPTDEVVQMQPPAGTKVAENTKVTLYWSDGPEEVPDVVGKTESQARNLIEKAGFKASVVQTTSTEEKKGTVVEQSPDQGTTLNKGSQVTIVVSAYEPPSPTPTPTPTAPPTPSATVSPPAPPSATVSP